jgi:hypothetical protein
MPQELGLPEHDGAADSLATLEANTDRFFDNFLEPHCGQGVPSHLLERTRISLSAPHFPQ